MLYEYWLAKVKHLSARKKRRLRERFENARKIYNIEETQLKNVEFLTEKDVNAIILSKTANNIEKDFYSMLEKQIHFVTYFSEEYPKRLQEIPSPPYALYYKGRMPDDTKKTVAIVGSRHCTTYGEQLALEYGEVLADAGVQIISGMAKGIDGAGQRGALNGQGQTYGVLGCGVDVCYPRENIGLYADIQKSGGILSEQPPGEPPFASYFPARNRIISGLSDVVLVMEAKEKSGSLITADMALEQGKDVYALPGPVTNPMSQGCHRLISQGAGILLSPQELLNDLQISREIVRQRTDENKKVLERTENMVYSCLDLFPKNIHSLVEMTGMEPEEVMRELVSLQLEGKIKEISKNFYIRMR